MQAEILGGVAGVTLGIKQTQKFDSVYSEYNNKGKQNFYW